MERSFLNGGKTAQPSLALQAIPEKERMIHHPSSSLELEMPVEFLKSWITPVSHFFVRNHLGVPSISPGAEWRLTVTGEVKQPSALSLCDLTGMEPHSITAVLECAGNGRAFYRPETPGTQWQRGALGNAHFSGVRRGPPHGRSLSNARCFTSSVDSWTLDWLNRTAFSSQSQDPISSAKEIL